MQVVDRITSELERYIRPQGLKVLSLIGLAFVASKSLGAISSLFRTFVHFGHNLSQRYGPGSWVLITGGAQGIGAAFANQLAAKGFNLILVDIDESKLNATSAAITTEYPTVRVKTLACDFSKVWQEGFLNFLDKELEGLDISILVNNVGRALPPGPLHSTTEKDVVNTVAVNILPMTLLTRRIVPGMLKRTQRSAIINLASVSALYPWPNIAPVYGATKAYVDILARSVSEEVGHKIDVLSVRPSSVSTALIRNPPLGGDVISAPSFVTATLKKLGSVNATNGHWRHEIKTWIASNDFIRGTFNRRFIKRYSEQKAKLEAAAAAAAKATA